MVSLIRCLLIFGLVFLVVTIFSHFFSMASSFVDIFVCFEFDLFVVFFTRPCIIKISSPPSLRVIFNVILLPRFSWFSSLIFSQCSRVSFFIWVCSVITTSSYSYILFPTLCSLLLPFYGIYCLSIGYPNFLSKINYRIFLSKIDIDYRIFLPEIACSNFSVENGLSNFSVENRLSNYSVENLLSNFSVGNRQSNFLSKIDYRIVLSEIDNRIFLSEIDYSFL